MTTYFNQIQHRPIREDAQHHELATTWHHEDVVGFRFECDDVIIHKRMDSDTVAVRVHGLRVDPRHVWDAMSAFCTTVSKVEMRDGTEMWCHVYTDNCGERHIRAGAGGLNYGMVLASRKVQEEWK